MTINQFIQQNKDTIDQGIRRYLGDPQYKLNNTERKQWILNEEELYNWAIDEGVRI